MKQVIAIIPPHRLEEVETALHRLEHFPGFTLLRAHGHPRGAGPRHAFHEDWNPDGINEFVLMIFCADSQAQEITDTICSAAHTGNPHDGLIAVSDIANVTRIRGGQSGNAAV